MKKVYLLSVILFSTINLFAQELPYAWNLTSQPIKPSGTATYTVTSSTLDNSGNIIVTGYFTGTCDFDPSTATANLIATGPSRDIFLVKYSPLGQLIGTPKQIGGTGTETSGNIIFDAVSGSVFLTGSFSGTCDFNPSVTANNLIAAGTSDAFLAKYDVDGNYQAAYNFGSTGTDTGNWVRIYGGDIYLTGTYSGTVNFGGTNLTSTGGTDVFITRYTSAATLVWAKSIGSATGDDFAGGMRIADNFFYYYQGVNNLAFDFDPGVSNTNTAGVNGSNDFAFAKYDLNGNMVWVRTIGGPGADSGGLNVINGSDVYVSGYFQQTVDLDPGAGSANATSNDTDAFLCRINANGDLVWSKTWSAVGSNYISIEQVLPDNTLLLTGNFTGTIDLDPNSGVFNQSSAGLADGFFMRMNSSGNFLDGFSVGGAGNDNQPGVLNDGTSKFYLGAYYSTTIDFDPTTDVNGITTAPSASQYFATSYSYLATVPTAQPTTLGFNTITDNSLNFSFTPAAGTPAGYLVIRKSGSAPTGIPKDGVSYVPGNNVGDGYVVQSSASTSSSDGLLAANTNYFYQVFSYNGSGLATNYLPGAPLQNNVTTSSITFDRTSDSLALVSFYNSTGGASWTTQTNWLTANPIDTWYGITLAGNRVAVISLPSNNLNGPIPGAIGNLSALTNLTLNGNQISGSLPNELGSITSLTILNLNGNLISGPIQNSLTNLTSLVTLNLSSNKIGGTIPSSIGNLTLLQNLYLSINQLTGSIPVEIGNLTALKNLWLNQNNLTGGIPVELGSLTSLQYLELYHNKLSGGIPVQIGNMSSLLTFNIDDTDISGSIPVEIGNISTLQIFSSSRAKLSGNIPSFFGSLTNLTELWFDNNQFTGVVPNSFSSLTNLTSLYIDHNQLTDLPDLSGLSSLVALSASNNLFTFEDLEPNISKLGASTNYSPQAIFGAVGNQSIVVGQPLNLSFVAGAASNIYQWKKNTSTNVGTNSNSFSIPSVTTADAATYTLTITNSVVTGLTLTSANQIVSVKAEGLFDWVSAGDLTSEGFNPGGTTDQNYSGQWGDFNNDGFEDVFVLGTSPQERGYLFKNNGNGAFSKIPNSAYFFTSGRSVAWADYNNDGFLDCFAPFFSVGDSVSSASIFKNNGNETFSKVSLPGNPSGIASTAGVWADTDSDGDVDLILNGGLGFPILYQNNGGDAFVAVQSFSSNVQFQWNMIAIDANNDNKMDVYFPDNQGARSFYLGNGNNSFTQNTTTPLVTDAITSGPGASWADIDNDGDIDAFLIASPDGAFYINNGTGVFTKQTATAVLGEVVTGGRGAIFSDYDNDGYVDLLTIQTNVTPAGWYLFRNNGNGTFAKQTGQSFKTGNSTFMGASFGDYNNDGFLDIVSASFGQDYNGLYRNKGNSNHWLQLKLTGTVSNRSAIGAKVSVKAGGFWRHNQVLTTNGFANQNSFIQQFGLGTSTVADSVKIQWPSGYKQTLANVVADQRTTITEIDYLSLDSMVLVTLYNSTNGSGWTNKTNWLTGAVSTWNGVTVTNGRVTAINLSYNKLTGTIPVELGTLTNLTSLNLSGNQLTGGVPTEFNNLDALAQLSLSNNSLTDLPVLTGMASITGFYVDTNLFTFEDIQPNVTITGFNYCCQKSIPFGGTIPIPVGGAVNLSATIGGTGNVYQWKKFGASISGATTDSYSVATSTISDAGIYVLEVTNPAAPNLTVRTTDYVVQIKSLTASDDSGYTFWKKLGAEALGITQIKPGGQVNIDNLGNYYYAFAGNGAEIQKLSPSGNLLYTLGSGNNDIGGTDIAIDNQNSIYVPGANYYTLKKYNSSGSLVFETPTYGGYRPFQAIDVDLDGSILAMDNSGGVSGRIKRFDSTTGNLIGQISLTGGPVSNYNTVFDFDLDASGNIYVPDDSRIDKFSPTGVFISSIDVNILNSWGGVILQVANNGHVYAANWFIGNIYHFDNTGVLVNNFGFNNAGFSSLTISASNELIAGTSSGLGILRFDLNGNFLGFGEPRNANGQFNYTTGIANDSKGFRYVVDKFNDRIQKLTANGTWVSNIGAQGSGAGQFNQPGSIAIDKTDNLYVTDDNNNRVQKFNSSGTHLLTIGSAGTGNGQFTNPVAITISKTGEIIVADKGNSRVQIFKPDGTFVSAFGTSGTGQGQFTNLQTLVVENDGAILTSDGQARLQRFTSQGTFVSELNMYGPVTSIPKVATDIDGFLYIPTGGVVKKFDKNGGHIVDIGLPITSTLADGELRSISVSSNVVGDTLWIADDIITNRMSIFTSNFKKASAPDSLALVDLYSSTKGATWTNKTNWLTGAVNTWHGVTMSGGKIRKLDLQNNNLDGPLPASVITLDNLLTLNLNTNKLSGSLPNWNVPSALLDVDLSQNLFAGATQTLPTQTEKLDLSDNQLTDVATLPPFIIGADLSNNKIDSLGNLPLTHANLDTLLVQNNKLSFEDLEQNISIPYFTYSPQDTVSTFETYLKQLGTGQTFTSAIGGTANSYQWKKGGTDIPETNADLTLANISFNDDATYSFTATNSIVPGLTLSSAKKILRVSSLERDEIALTKLYNDTDGPNWIRKDNWVVTPLATGNWFGVTIANNRVTQVTLPNNLLKGSISAIVADIQNLVSLDLSNNAITSLPDLTSYPSISTLDVSKNKLDFASLEKNAAILGINYVNQDSLGTLLDTLVNVGEPMKFKLSTGGTTNVYQWKRNGTNVTGATDSTYQLTAIGRSNMGEYICEVTNSKVPGLILKSKLQRARAVANISGKLQIDTNTPVTAGKITLLKINAAGALYSIEKEQSVKPDGTYLFEKVVLDDYLLLGQGDTTQYKSLYFPTYFDGSVFWEEADTIKLNENVTDLNYSLVALPTEKPKGVGEISGVFIDELPGGRTENRGRVAGASATVRRATSAGRPDRFGRTMAGDVIVAFVYTDENGEFDFTNLEEGSYLLNLQYPGVPMDPKSDVVITIGAADKHENVQKVEAVAVGGKIVVKRLVIVGVSEEEQKTVQIYPNPTSSALYINLTEGSGAADMKMFDRTGREVHTQHIQEGKTALDMNKLSPGIYLIKTYRHGKEVSAARVMVE